eukprot:1851673-Pyramimonas_sp.AAC.2
MLRDAAWTLSPPRVAAYRKHTRRQQGFVQGLPSFEGDCRAWRLAVALMVAINALLRRLPATMVEAHLVRAPRLPRLENPPGDVRGCRANGEGCKMGR